MVPPETEPQNYCSRCENPLDTTGYPLWCKKCRAKHQREYRELVKQMAETRGFAAGVSAMRDAVRALFLHWPSAHFSGVEIAAKVQTMKAPYDLA